MDNPEDKGRFGKELLRDVPQDLGLTRSESALRATVKQTGLLREIRDGLSVRHTPSPSVSSAPAAQPQVYVKVETSELARTLGSRFDDMAENQREAAYHAHTLVQQSQAAARRQEASLEVQEASLEVQEASLGVQEEGVAVQRKMWGDLMVQTKQGEHAAAQRAGSLQQGNIAIAQRSELIDTSNLQAMLLASLDEAGRDALMQRWIQIGVALSTRKTIEEMGQRLGGGIDRVDARLIELHRQGHVGIEELRNIARIEGLGLEEAKRHTQSLQKIDAGIQEMGRLVQDGTQGIIDATHEGTRVMDERLREQLAQIAETNRRLDILNDIAERANDHLAHIGGASDMIALNTSRIRRAVEEIATGVITPVQTRARDRWVIGEQCRMAGDSAKALEQFRQSHSDNPAEPRNYYSLGMLCLESRDIDTAQDFFVNGLRYTQDDPALKMDFLLAMGKLEHIRQQPERAKVILEEALGLDRRNLDIWYELAVVEMKLGNDDQAVYYLKNILQVVRQTGTKKSPYVQYAQKILNDPIFKSIRPRL